MSQVSWAVPAGGPRLLGVALDGAGAHPAAWTPPGTSTSAGDARRAAGWAVAAEAAGFDLVAFDDALDPPVDGVPPWRFDALLTAAFVAMRTARVGLLATVTTTHTEPFHVAKNIATLDHVSHGRAAWRVAVSPTEAAAARFGRRGAPSTTDLAAEAADTVEVVRRLWDSWEDDAVIRDRETGRYVDRDKLHYVDFTGPYFSVRGPSITPRSPQGQPIVAVERDGVLDGLAVAEADLVLVRGRSVDEVADGVSAVHAEARSHGRPAGSPAVLVEVRVGDAAGRVALDGVRPPGPGVGLDVVGDAAHVRAGLEELLGIADGVLLHPDALDTTLDWLAGDVVGPLVSGHRPSVATLRDRLGLARPANRYASAGAT